MGENFEHSVTITQRKKVSIIGVCEIEGVSEQKITLSIVGGKRLTIFGEGLKMGAFSKQSGTFFVDGLINELKYDGEKLPIIKKLLK